MIKIQDIDFPVDCKIFNHDFYNYDPVNSFNEEDSLKYLNEDLLQCSFPHNHMTIDLGWYGDVASNKGEYKIHIIQNENWEHPFKILYSKSTEEIKGILTKILLYYTGAEKEVDSE